MTATPMNLIRSTPGVCGGDACIRDTRIMVWLLVLYQRRGTPDADILANYPGLTSEDLDAAWDYYRCHPAEIERALWINNVAANQAPRVPVPPGGPWSMRG